MNRLRLLLAGMLLALWGAGAAAQGTATLVADSLQVTPEGVLIAQGGVEVLYDGTRMRAAAVRYDRDADRLTLTGPLVVTRGDGDVFTASEATLDPGLRNGLLRSARLVLDRQLQLAAAQINRVDGRYAQLSQVAVTSCQVCGTRPPLWSIRADRVIHDEDAQQIYFENAGCRSMTCRSSGCPTCACPIPS